MKDDRTPHECGGETWTPVGSPMTQKGKVNQDQLSVVSTVWYGVTPSD